jgi:protein MpaA
MKKKRSNGLVVWIWLGNLAGLALLAGLGLWLLAPRAAQAGMPSATPVPTQPRATRTPKPSITPIPPPTRRPTFTPWPTPSRGPSVTPFSIAPANRTVIGYSIENRPQEVFRFGVGATPKLIVAGIHGGSEWNTVALADELIAYLNDHPERVPENISLYILRDLNPDGTARAHGVDGRVNAHGVDLNRNWPYNWVENWSRDGCWIWRPVTGGEYGGSEPEVQNLIAFIDTINPAALISYHSAALGIFPGGRPDYGPSIRLAEAVAEVSDYPYPPLDTGCDYTGNLTDWAANTRGIPSIDIELTNHRDTDFDQNLRVLQTFLAWKK